MKLLILIGTLITWFQCNAQEYKIYSNRGDTINNFGDILFYSIDGIDSIKLTSSSGELWKNGKNSYSIRRANAGSLIIKSILFISNDSITKFDTLVVVDVNRYRADLGSSFYNNNTISRGELLTSRGLAGKFDFDCSCDANLQIKCFEIEIIQGEEIIYNLKSSKAVFSKEIKQTFRKTKKNYRLKFKNVFVIGMDGKKKRIKDFTITII